LKKQPKILCATRACSFVGAMYCISHDCNESAASRSVTLVHFSLILPFGFGRVLGFVCPRDEFIECAAVFGP